MSLYNRFGAVYTDLPALYPGTVAADMGGQAAMEDAIDTAVDRIVAALPETSFAALTHPKLCRVVRRATSGQTAVSIPLYPVVANTLVVWSGQPYQFEEPDRDDGEGWPDDRTDWTLTEADGSLVLATGLALEDHLYASWEVDVDNASFAADSLARLALRGAAAELGARLFTEATQEWKLVDAYRMLFDQALAAFKDGSRIPDEIRRLTWWEEVLRREPGGIHSIRISRG